MAQYYPERLSMTQINKELRAQGIESNLPDLAEQSRSVAFPGLISVPWDAFCSCFASVFSLRDIANRRRRGKAAPKKGEQQLFRRPFFFLTWC
jgi:hypothetical protein